MGKDLHGALRRLQEHLTGTGRVLLVGGLVRDLLLKLPPRDIDLLVECSEAEEEQALTRLEQLSGREPIRFHRRPPATYRVLLAGILVDTSFCRPGTLEKALRRRDFTINAMAAPLPAAGESPDRLRGAIIDPANGLRDLREGLLEAVSPEALDEDPLRLLRAVRLRATLPGFDLSSILRREIRARAPSVTRAATERIRAELDILFETSRSGEGLREMESLGLLSPILPELEPLRGLRQPRRYHDHDVFEHTLRAVEEADLLARGFPPLALGPLEPGETIILKFAATLHDIGKNATATVDEGGAPHFHGHESVSASLAAERLRRLRMPAESSAVILSLIEKHLRPGALASVVAGDRPIRRLVRSAGSHLDLLLRLSLADRRAAGGEEPEVREEALLRVARRALQLRQDVEESATAPPLVTGKDVIRVLGLKPGPRIGTILRWLDRLRAEGRLESREEALRILETLPPSRIPE